MYKFWFIELFILFLRISNGGLAEIFTVFAKVQFV